MKNFNNVYIDDFILYKYINQGISKNMLTIYYGVFTLLFNTGYIDPLNLLTYTTNNFKRLLGNEFIKKKWSSTTYNHYRKYFSCYCKYLVTEKYLEINPIDNIPKRKQDKVLPKALTHQQIKELLSNLENVFNKNTFVGIRNITIVYTYLYTGLRLSELTNLKLDDINLIDGYIRVIKGKGNKERIVPLNNTIIKILYNYLKTLNNEFLKPSILFFPTVKGNIIQKRDTTLIMKKIRYGITFYFTWHQLRHTFATELVRNNFDVYNISQILGHSNINTTKIYLSADTTKIKKQLDKIQLFV